MYTLKYKSKIKFKKYYQENNYIDGEWSDGC